MKRDELEEFIDSFYSNIIFDKLLERDGPVIDSYSDCLIQIARHDDNDEIKEAMDQTADLIAHFFHLANKECDVSPGYFLRNDLHALREAGQEEYAQDESDAFENFREAEMIMTYGYNIDFYKESALMVFLHKHCRGIESWFDGVQDQRESLRDRLGDAALYSFILAAMFSERRV